jgi:hypothetical protein
MSVTQKPLGEITWNDILKLCADQETEGPELEFKRDLPAKAGRRDPWLDNCQSIGEYARNEIAKEVVAFANTYGGTVLVGIEETKDKPNRASRPAPLPQAHELARRLRQAIYDVIDPPLPVLEATGVEADSGKNGVIVIRVSVSRRRPHRLTPNKEIYTRRADESAVMDMRQVQELTIHALAEARRIEDDIEKSRATFREAAQEWMGSEQVTESTNHTVTLMSAPKPGCAFKLFAVPTAPIDLGRVAGRSDIYPIFGAIKVAVQGQSYDAEWPFSPTDWRPTLRAIFAESSFSEYKHRYVLRTDGSCELSLFQRRSNDQKGFFVEWLVAAVAGMLFWIERIRRAGGVFGLEYALAVEFNIIKVPAVLCVYGARQFSGFRNVQLPSGEISFPLISVGGEEEFETLLERFDEDIWNYAGKHFPGSAPTFDVKQLRAQIR